MATRATNLSGSCGILATPEFSVGQEVIWLNTKDRAWFQAQYRRHLLSKWKPTDRNLGSVIVDKVMGVITSARTVEIAGIAPQSMHCVDYAEMNECYLQTAPGIFSGVAWQYYLLVRWEEGGNRLAMITGAPVAGDRDLQA